MANKAGATETVAVPEFRPKRIRLEIEGKSELLCNRVTEETKDRLPGGSKVGEQKEGDTRKWSEIALDGAYRHPETGLYVFPSSGLMNAIASASFRMKFTKGAPEIYANLRIDDEWIEIEGAAPRARQDVARNRNAQGSPLIVANRAEFPKGWIMRPVFEFNSAAKGMTAKRIGMLVEAAGFGIGIGCWRPENKGRFGRFGLLRTPRESDAQEISP